MSGKKEIKERSERKVKKEITEEYLDELFSEWAKIKKDMAKLENKKEKLKNIIMEIMDTENVNTLITNNFKMQRREISRESLSKNNVPEDIWNKYSKKTSFENLYFKEY